MTNKILKTEMEAIRLQTNSERHNKHEQYEQPVQKSPASS